MAEAYLLVVAGGRMVALPVAQLEGVAEPGPVTPVPSAEPALRGVGAVRNGTLPIVNLDALLRGGSAGTPPEAMVIVSAGGVRLGLEVDAADIVLHGEPLPAPGDGSLPWARAVIRHEGALVPLLDLGALGARMTDTGRA